MGRSLRSASRWTLLAASLLVALLAAVSRFDSTPSGLTAHYFANSGWVDPPAFSLLDTQFSGERMIERWNGAPPEIFSARWTGSILIPRSGLYTFAVISDDGSSVRIDEQLVVDNPGVHGPQEARGSANLVRGVHQIQIDYAQQGGGFRFDLQSGRNSGPLSALPPWTLIPADLPLWQFAASLALRWSLAGAGWLWVIALTAALVAPASSLARKARLWVEREQGWPALGWIIAGSALLTTTGLWWGLPDGSWVPDELTPNTIFYAVAQGFSHGWWDRYPPLHFYLLTVAYSPLLLLERLGGVNLQSSAAYTLVAVIGRLVSVAAGVVTLVAVYATGARAFGRRAGLYAAAMLALAAPFVYYAKTANLDVPYVCWFALSLLFYLRLLKQLELTDFVAFAVCAALAVCTKDQAYGLYLLVPPLIVYRLWQVHREKGSRQPMASALLDRRLWTGAAIAAMLFLTVHNLVFNWTGFEQHVRFLVGGGSRGYQMFPRTAAGELDMFRFTLDLIRAVWGWPLFVVAAAGIALAAITPATRRTAWWLALPALSYYLTFTAVVLYNYDRFVLPVCVVLSMFGGLALDRAISPGGHINRWGVAAGSVVLAYSLLYAGMVDVVMLRDSRYSLERWLSAHADAHDLVGYVFPVQYYPRIRYENAEITSIEQLAAARPAYYLLNADYGRAEPADSEVGRLIAGLHDASLGYRLVLRLREPPVWPWLPGAHRDLIGPRTEPYPSSAMRHINPTYEVFKREPPAQQAARMAASARIAAQRSCLTSTTQAGTY
jgi:hypothetical protein